jgi:ABC-type phosphate transport system permease subunit
MEQKEYTKMTDEELLNEAKEMKSFSFTNALLIGFLVGVIFYSVVKNSWGMLTLIPLYFIYKLINDPKNKKGKELQSLFKERNLKW